MKDPDAFDEFYKSTRARLLLQTYALTGDLGASRAAVRDAFVLGWHHWRKVSRLEDPETAVRPNAWRHAQRRHTARLWHREKDLDPEVKQTLDVLGQLTMRQRKALLLAQVAEVSIPQMARELGVPIEEAERELQTAVGEFTRLREVPTVGIRGAFAPLERATADDRFPRATIIRRAGAARRRTHTSVGAIVAVAVFLVSGTLVTDAGGVRPSLDRAAAGSSPERPGPDDVPDVPLPESSLLAAAQLDEVLDGRTWTEDRTHGNTRGSTRLLPCQREPYADADGSEALFRHFTGVAPRKRTPAGSAVQLTEASATQSTARRTYSELTGWFAGCTDPRVQLIATRRVEQVGDQAVQLVLRAWSKPVTTYVVGLARSGLFTTATVDGVVSDAKPDVERSARLLATAVEGLCALEEGGGCAVDRPRLDLIRPVPTGVAPALLSEVDLPPVSKVDLPWVGTEPQRVSSNMAATRCDDASFTGKYQGARFTRGSTRTFVIPEADLPDEFGLTETVAALPAKKAAAFLAEMRDKLGRCADRDLGTDVTPGRTLDRGDRSFSVWHLRTQLSDERVLTYSMAFLRSGTSVGQLSFVRTPAVGMSPGAFDDLALRALDRLGELSRPR